MSGTVVFKGVTFSPDVAPLVPRMALVNDHRESLQRLEDTWDQLGLLAQMTGSGTSIAATGARFHALTGVLLDGNHPLAGQELRFVLKVLDVRAAAPEELEHRHVHGAGGHHH